MASPTDFDVTLDDYRDVATEPLGVKLQCAVAELNIALNFAEVAAVLSGIPKGAGVRALKAGVSADAAVFWALGDNDELFIAVGHDDETWDFGITLTASNCQGLLKELARFQEKVMRSGKSLEPRPLR